MEAMIEILVSGEGMNPVIASEAKQSSLATRESWIASSLSFLAMTG
jgi:hypothetical protein